MFIVRELRVAYARPAQLDDLLDVTVGVEHLGRAQFTLAQQVLRGGEALVRASVNLACVTQRLVPADARARGAARGAGRTRCLPLAAEEGA